MFNTQNVRQLGMQLMDWFQWSFLTGEAWVFNIIMGILIGFPQKSITRLSLTTTTHSESIRNRPYHDQLPCNKTASWAGSSTFPIYANILKHETADPRISQLSDSWMRGPAVSLSWPSMSAGVLHCQQRKKGLALPFLNLFVYPLVNIQKAMENHRF